SRVLSFFFDSQKRVLFEMNGQTYRLPSVRDLIVFMITMDPSRAEPTDWKVEKQVIDYEGRDRRLGDGTFLTANKGKDELVRILPGGDRVFPVDKLMLVKLTDEKTKEVMASVKPIIDVPERLFEHFDYFGNARYQQRPNEYGWRAKELKLMLEAVRDQRKYHLGYIDKYLEAGKHLDHIESNEGIVFRDLDLYELYLADRKVKDARGREVSVSGVLAVESEKTPASIRHLLESGEQNLKPKYSEYANRPLKELYYFVLDRTKGKLRLLDNLGLLGYSLDLGEGIAHRNGQEIRYNLIREIILAGNNVVQDRYFGVELSGPRDRIRIYPGAKPYPLADIVNPDGTSTAYKIELGADQDLDLRNLQLGQIAAASELVGRIKIDELTYRVIRKRNLDPVLSDLFGEYVYFGIAEGDTSESLVFYPKALPLAEIEILNPDRVTSKVYQYLGSINQLLARLKAKEIIEIDQAREMKYVADAARIGRLKVRQTGLMADGTVTYELVSENDPRADARTHIIVHRYNFNDQLAAQTERERFFGIIEGTNFEALSLVPTAQPQPEIVIKNLKPGLESDGSATIYQYKIEGRDQRPSLTNLKNIQLGDLAGNSKIVGEIKLAEITKNLDPVQRQKLIDLIKRGDDEVVYIIIHRENFEPIVKKIGQENRHRWFGLIKGTGVEGIRVYPQSYPHPEIEFIDLNGEVSQLYWYSGSLSNPEDFKLTEWAADSYGLGAFTLNNKNYKLVYRHNSPKLSQYIESKRYFAIIDGTSVEGIKFYPDQEHGYFRAVFTQESRTIEAELFGRSETISGQPAFRASAENMVEKDGRQIIGSFKVEYSDRGFVDVTQKLGDIYALKFLNKQGRRWLPPESLQLTDEQGKMKGLEPYRIVDRKGQELRLAVLDPRGVEVMRFYPDEDNPQKLVAAFFYPEADGRKRVVVAERKEAPANKKVFIIKAEDIDHRSQEFKEAKISVEFSGQPAERVDIDLKDLVVVGDEQFARDPDESRLYLVRKGLMHHEEYAQLFQIGKKPDHQGYLSYVAVLKDQTLIPNTDILGQIAVKARVKVEGDEVKELILDSKVDHYTRGVGKFEFVINGKIVKFTLVQAYRKDGKLDREFGVIKGKELISIGFDRHLFIVDKRLLDKKSGGTFIVDTDSDGRFRSIWQIHRSEEIDYKDLKEVDSQGRLIWDYHKVEAVMKQLKKSGRFSALPDLEKLVWVRMQTLDREGKVLKETIEAYDQAIPSIVISKGFLHLVVEKDAGRDKTGKERNKGLSIAFDLARKLESGLFISTAISRFVTP
ncbi:MAG: hypothetical protein KKH25_04825, partial [Candidatus Omnitrophica bacterium]|nr:hypothetical protein [Candidatus Omnitrophota bacterium]